MSARTRLTSYKQWESNFWRGYSIFAGGLEGRSRWTIEYSVKRREGRRWRGLTSDLPQPRPPTTRADRFSCCLIVAVSMWVRSLPSTLQRIIVDSVATRRHSNHLRPSSSTRRGPDGRNASAVCESRMRRARSSTGSVFSLSTLIEGPAASDVVSES